MNLKMGPPGAMTFQQRCGAVAPPRGCLCNGGGSNRPLRALPPRRPATPQRRDLSRERPLTVVSTTHSPSETQAASTIKELSFQPGQPEDPSGDGSAAPPEGDLGNPLLDEHTLRAFLAACATLMVVGLDAVDGPGHPSAAIACLAVFLALQTDASKAFLWERPAGAPVVFLAGAIAAAVSSVQRGTDPVTKTIHSIAESLDALRAPVPQNAAVVAEPAGNPRAEEAEPAVVDAAKPNTPRSTPAIPVAASAVSSAAVLPTAVTVAMAVCIGRGRGKIVTSSGPRPERMQGSGRAAINTLCAGLVALGTGAFGLAYHYVQQGMSVAEVLPGGMCAAAVLLMLLAALLLAKRPPAGRELGWAA
mmetsp:Transcript_38894/g.97702  ORF Transcript_38894/g.97702 Transcript_38894/m.97702 type:complete len:362 (+) Transcript_38894:100-1185(+)